MDKTQTTGKTMGYSLEDIFDLNSLDPDRRDSNE